MPSTALPALTYQRTRPPITDIVDFLLHRFSQNRLLCVIQVYEIVVPVSMVEVFGVSAFHPHCTQSVSCRCVMQFKHMSKRSSHSQRHRSQFSSFQSCAACCLGVSTRCVYVTRAPLPEPAKSRCNDSDRLRLRRRGGRVAECGGLLNTLNILPTYIFSELPTSLRTPADYIRE